MKKNYISPDYHVVMMKARRNLLLTISATEAKGDEVNFSRETDFDFDGEY